MSDTKYIEESVDRTYSSPEPEEEKDEGDYPGLSIERRYPFGKSWESVIKLYKKLGVVDMRTLGEIMPIDMAKLREQEQ